MEPQVAQRKPKDTSEEAKGDFRRATAGPRGPRCAPREARMPQRAKLVPKEASGQPLGHQDGPRGAIRCLEGVKFARPGSNGAHFASQCTNMSPK